MKVTYLTMRMPTQTETFAVSDIKELVAAGHTVDVQCLREAYKDSEALVKMYDLDSIPISHASMRTVLSLCWSLVASPRFTLSCFTIALRSAKLSPKHLRATLLLLPRAIEIVQAIHRSPPDIVHAFWGHYPSLVVLLLRRLGSKIPVTIFLGAYDLSEDYPITRLVLPEVDGVFTHAQANVPFLERCGIPPAQVKIVHRGIPIDDFERLEEGSRSCTQICTVSALEKAKRVDKVIAAFERILDRDARATLLVIGDGPERQALESQAAAGPAAHAIRFLGYRARDDVFRQMAASGMFLFLSEKDSDRLPNVVKEAMYAGCVSIVSNTLGITELIPSDAYGLVLTNSDPEHVAQVVLGLLGRPDRCRCIGEMARQRIVGHFSSKDSMVSYMKFWQSLRNRQIGPSDRLSWRRLEDQHQPEATQFKCD